MLGHASAAITLDVYAELFDEDRDTVTVAMNRELIEADWLFSEIRGPTTLRCRSDPRV